MKPLFGPLTRYKAQNPSLQYTSSDAPLHAELGHALGAVHSLAKRAAPGSGGHLETLSTAQQNMRILDAFTDSDFYRKAIHETRRNGHGYYAADTHKDGEKVLSYLVGYAHYSPAIAGAAIAAMRGKFYTPDGNDNKPAWDSVTDSICWSDPQDSRHAPPASPLGKAWLAGYQDASRDRTRKINLDILSHGPSGAGDKIATIDDVENVPVPERTATWSPLAHHKMVQEVTTAAERLGAPVVNEAFLLNKDGTRFFGLFQVNVPTIHGEIASVFGVRNSHDKSFRAGIMAGDAPFICSNLAFSNEIVIGQKHTGKFSHERFGHMVNEAFGQLLELKIGIDDCIQAKKDFVLPNLDGVEAHTGTSAETLAARAWQAGACSRSQLGAVLEQWYEPEHDDFRAPTMWSLQNAFSNVWRNAPNQTPLRSRALNNTLAAELVA